MTKFIPQFEPFIKKEYIKAVKNQISSGWIGTSGTTVDFEDKIKAITGHAHCISTTSGTMALWLGLSALNIPKGKTILFPSYTFLAGANVIKSLGYEIKFIDIKRETMCMNPGLIEITEDVAAIMFVDHNGYVGPDREIIKNICVGHRIHFIEDSAQGLGVEGAGCLGTFSIFSFSVPKLITTGQGGVVLTNNDDLADIIRQLRDHGDRWRVTKLHNNIGLNLKFNDMAAAYGLAQLNCFDNILLERKRIFDEYRQYINIIDFGYESTWMVIYPTEKIDQIIYELKLAGIQAVQYYRPIPSNPAFKNEHKYPDAEYVYDHYLYLPSSLNLKNKDIKKICSIIKDVENEKT